MNDSYQYMPSRTQFSTKNQQYDSNAYLNFDLKHTNDDSTNIKENEYNNTFAEINQPNTLTKQLNPMLNCVDGINRLTRMLMKFAVKNHLICSCGLYNLFGILYLSSHNNTEIELAKFFNFQKKNNLLQGLSDLNKKKYKTINIKTLIVVGSDVPHNNKFIRHVKDLCTVIIINANDVEKETSKLNHLIDLIAQDKMKNSINYQNLINLQLMFMIIGTVKPIWKYSCQTSIYNDREYIEFKSVEHNYYENENCKLIEIICDEDINFGFLIANDYKSIRLDKLISKLKFTLFDIVLVPKITINSKIRYNNYLKKIGLNSVFLRIDSKNLFPESCELQDVIQNIKIIIDDKSLKQSSGKKYNSTRKLIVENKFVYYCRCVKTGIIMFVGFYC